MTYEEKLADWANLTKEQRIELSKEERLRRPTDEKLEAAYFHEKYDTCQRMFEEYLNTLGPFEVVAGHGHTIDVTSKRAREDLIERLSAYLTGGLLIMEPPVVRYTIAQHQAGETLQAHGEALRCSSCGEHSHIVEITGTKLRPLVYERDPHGLGHVEFSECPIDPTQPYSVEIDIPSGEMIVANHLAQLFDEIKDKYAERNSINYVWGRKNCTEEYAKQGYIEMNIGNCSCELFQMNAERSKFIMGDSDSVSGRRTVARVCTDFWGYGIADHEDAKRRGLATKMPDLEYSIVRCVPGRYRFIHRYHLLRSGLSDDGIYTYIERVEA